VISVKELDHLARLTSNFREETFRISKSFGSLLLESIKGFFNKFRLVFAFAVFSG